MKIISYKTAIIGLFAIGLGHNSSLAQEAKVADAETVKQWMENTKTPTVGIAVIDHGKVIQSKVYGIKGSTVNAEDNVLFNVASLTKSVSMYTALRLMNKGQWSMNEPLAKYWTDPEVKGDPHAEKLTTKHVLNHQTGFKNWRWQEEDEKLKFNFEPGTKTLYSGEGFEYLKKAMSQKLNQPLEKIAQDLVFDEFGMENSHYIWSSRINEANLAGAFDQEGRAYETVKRKDAMASDDMLISINDLATFSAAVLNQEGISDELYKQMTTAQAEVKPGLSYSYSWIVFEDLPNGQYAIANFGSDDGVNCAIVLLPESKSGLVVTTNADGGRAIVMQAIMAVLGDTGKSMLSRF